MNTKDKGDEAEAAVLADLIRRGHKVAIPFGENWRYDLIVNRHNKLERVQVKHVQPTDGVLVIHCYSVSVTQHGDLRHTTYTTDEIDWLAVFDGSSVFYIPISDCTGQGSFTLRIAPPSNGQTKGVRYAMQYLAF